MIREQSYYLTYNADKDNARRTERDLIVNCCGLINLPMPFETIRLNGREDFYLCYLVGGRMEIQAENGVQTMVPGQMITYFPRTPSVYKSRGSEPVQYYWVHFTGAKAEELIANGKLKDREIVNIRNMAVIAAEFESLFEEFSKRDAYFDFLSASLLTSIVIQTDLHRERAQDTGAARNLQHAITYIHTNYQNSEISVEHLAELEHLSPSRFRTVFKEKTGLSPKDYILTHKINHAKQLLYQTDFSIKEIAIEMGYSDQLYFSRIFRKKTGYNPSEYRSMQLTKSEQLLG